MLLDATRGGALPVEPYVVAADVYRRSRALADAAAGPGTRGSAGWLYRAATEAILGIRKEGNRLYVEPALPRAGTPATLKIGASICRIQVSRETRQGPATVSVNGKRVKEIVIDGRKGEKHILVTVPA